MTSTSSIGGESFLPRNLTISTRTGSWNSLPTESGPGTNIYAMKENTSSTTAQNSGSVLSYIARNPIKSFARALCIGIGGTLYGVSMVLNSGISLACYLPAAVVGGVGSGIGYAIDCLCGSRGDNGESGPATAALGILFITAPFAGGLIAAANPASLIVRGCIALVGVAGAGLLAAGMQKEGTFDSLSEGLLFSMPDVYIKMKNDAN